MVDRSRLALAAWIVAPVVLFIVVIFGGGHIRSCLGGGVKCYPAVEPGPIAFLGTPDGEFWTAIAIVVIWLGAGGWLLRGLARRGHPLLLEAVRTTLVGGFVGGGLGFAYGLLEGHRLRAGAKGAVIVAIIGVVLAWEIRLVWLALRAGPDPRRAA